MTHSAEKLKCGCTITSLRRRILATLEQRGPMDIQEIGYEFTSNPRGLPQGFRHPAAATRFGGMLAAPLRAAGLLHTSDERFGCRRKLEITAAGRVALRRSGEA